MGMPDTARHWTRETVLALPDDGNRYELFDGELLVTPSPAPPHQIAVTILSRTLDSFCSSNGLGWVMTSPADLSLGGEQLSQPDLFVLPFLPDDRSSWTGVPNPVLVVEILSPSTARYDRIIKRRRFQGAGIPDYWVVDLDARVVECWRPLDQRPEILDETLLWHPETVAEPLRIDLSRLFVDALGS
jgi:Uma2 family endonuclease